MAVASAARAATALALVAVGKALSSAVVLASGFRALSDDDYARVVIAQRFSENAALDPSGTSWLPLPFWLYGALMKVFGPSLGVARATAFALGVASALLVFGAARLLGLARSAAVISALLGGAIPYSAYLGVATVPESLSAALCVVGAAALASSASRARLLGALALAGACACRYEPWAVAAAFAAFSALDAYRLRSPALAGAAALALAFPLLWMAHGAHGHGDALFFVQRVSAYQHALGGGPDSLAERLFRFPLALFKTEPEIMTLALAGVGASLLLGFRSELDRFKRPALALAALLAALVAGDLGAGAPTHHAERALLAVWLVCAVIAGTFVPKTLAALAPVKRFVAATAALIVLIALGALRPSVSGIDRSDEIAIGDEARRLGADRVAVATPDFGYFAITAALAEPSRVLVMDDRDPRGPRIADAFESVDSLRRRLGELGARWLVAGRVHDATALQVGRPAYENAQFSLLELSN
jgi:hypothetical protein